MPPPLLPVEKIAEFSGDLSNPSELDANETDETGGRSIFAPREERSLPGIILESDPFHGVQDRGKGNADVAASLPSAG